MNSTNGKSNKSASLNIFDFDLGINSNRSRPLKDQKNQSSTFGSTQSRPNMMSSATPSWQPNKPSWAHQPAASQSGIPGSLSGRTSMVGDISGKSWNSSNPSSTASKIGIANKNPNLFGDLLSSAMGQNKGSCSNVPLMNAAPISNKGAYSMRVMADTLPKTGNTVKSSGTWGSNGSSESYTSAYNSHNNVSASNTNNKGPNLWGQPMRSLDGSGSAGGVGMSSNKDPFDSLVDFGSKPANSVNSSSKGNNKTNSDDNVFGDFQKPDSSMYSSTGGYNKTSSDDNNFWDFQKPESSMYSSMKGNNKTMLDDNLFGGFQNASKSKSVASSGVDAFDWVFSSNSSTVGHDTKKPEGSGLEQFSGADDWGYSSEFGGGDDSSGTSELEGLPPPPAGVTASIAKSKGMDNQKQGQYADAIKWLSWAVILFEKSGDDAGTMELLSCRASCYKEVGEYKKAVADCTKVLENDSENISVLVQRALLYESMEKYKLGAEDLRTVMKFDPGNRVARSTIHRLTKMAG